MTIATRFAQPGQAIFLDKLDPMPPARLDKSTAKARFAKLEEELFELQDLLWGAKMHSVLVVLQGRDTAGKDGTINKVMGCLNPRGVHVVSFGVPTEAEKQFDFLHRIHQVAPRRGELAIFNRSHYEDVLVPRVHKWISPKVYKGRYRAICAFEEQLHQAQTIIIKIFLHISKEEQLIRLVGRELSDHKAWKLNVVDWEERKIWASYTRAYEDAMRYCATTHAPWWIVPAEKKWARNLAVAEIICRSLRPHKKTWLEQLEKEGEKQRRALKAYRKRLSQQEREEIERIHRMLVTEGRPD